MKLYIFLLMLTPTQECVSRSQKARTYQERNNRAVIKRAKEEKDQEKADAIWAEAKPLSELPKEEKMFHFSTKRKLTSSDVKMSSAVRACYDVSLGRAGSVRLRPLR